LSTLNKSKVNTENSIVINSGETATQAQVRSSSVGFSNNLTTTA